MVAALHNISQLKPLLLTDCKFNVTQSLTLIWHIRNCWMTIFIVNMHELARE